MSGAENGDAAAGAETRPPAAGPSPSGTAAPSHPTEGDRARPPAEADRTHQVGRKPADPPNESVIADALAALGHHLEAVFVRHFEGRQSTTWQDLVEAVCPGEERDWRTVKTWVNRVKNALRDADPRCRLSFHTSGRDFRVIKRILPE